MSKNKPAALGKPFVNRIVGSGTEKVDQLLANPKNFRLHPDSQQQALAGAIDEIGFIRSVTVNKVTGCVVDGHLRVTIAARSGVDEIPVEYVELTDEEESKALLFIDPIAALAASDRQKLETLISSVNSDDARVTQMLEDVAAANGILDIDFDTFETDGDGGGSRMGNGTKVRVVIGPIMFDIDDADGAVYRKAKDADPGAVQEQIESLIESGSIL